MGLDDRALMLMALKQARECSTDVPVGSVLVNPKGSLVARSRNTRVERSEILGHAEALVITKMWGSSQHGPLDGYSLYSTLEPCVFCAGLIRETNISRVVYGASNPQKGAGGSVYDILRDKRLGAPLEVIAGVEDVECQKLLDDFFSQIRTPL